MRLTIIAIVLAVIIWFHFDPETRHFAATELAQAKRGIVQTACPPSNATWVCHIMVEWLGD